MTDLLTERLHASAERIPTLLPVAIEVRQGAEHARRVRRAIAGTVVGAVILIITLSLTSRADGGLHTAPLPAATPTPTPGVLALADQPFLTEAEWEHTQSNGEPEAMSECITNPLTWGAAEVRGATYGSAGLAGPVFNEFVLRFDSAAEAHQAVTDVWQQFVDCPIPPEVIRDPLTPPSADFAELQDEGFANQRTEFATAEHLGQPTSMYALRVSRRSNVVIVLEDTGEPDDRAGVIMTVALEKAIRSE